MSHASNSHITKVGLWGMPFHGLVQYVGGSAKLALPAETLAAVPATPTDYVLAGTLANGIEAYTQEGIQVFVETFPSIGKRFYLPWDLYDNNHRTAGTCRLWQNPATPAVVRSPAEAAEDLQRGHTWRDYALFGGNAAQIARASAKRLGGLNWVYLASDGSRWQIALSTPDSGANPRVIRYAFRKFGHFDNDPALSLSTPVNFLSIPNGTPAIPSLNLNLWISGVNKTGSQTLLITSDPVEFSTQPPPASFIINQLAMNRGPAAFVHRLDVSETLSGAIVTGIVVTATELKNRAACQPGVQTVTPESIQNLGYPYGPSGSTVPVLVSRAWKIKWLFNAYFTSAGDIEFAEVEYSDAWAGTASASYGFEYPEPAIPPCFVGNYTGWTVTEDRTHTQKIIFRFGATEYVYQSIYHRVSSDVASAVGDHEINGTSSSFKEWTSITPFSSETHHETSSSATGAPGGGGGPAVVCIGDAAPVVGSVSSIPANHDYGGFNLYLPSSGSLPIENLIVPMPIITGEGVSGIVELSKPGSSWQYQYRLLSAYGTEHTLFDAAVTLNLSAPINDRIPLFATVHPITGEYIYGQVAPVCYV